MKDEGWGMKDGEMGEQWEVEETDGSDDRRAKGTQWWDKGR